MRKNKVIMFTMLLLTLGAQQLLASTITYAVGTCKPALPSYTTISEAVAASPAPNVVEVCPGTYNEQVSITQPMTLEGVSDANSGQVIIAPPSGGLVVNATTNPQGQAIAAQVFVGHVTGTVTITDITLDAIGNGAPNASVVGIFYQESSGTVNRVATRNQTANGSGVGIWAEGGGGTPSVTVENSSIHNFDGIGIYAEAIPGFVGSTATITAIIESNDLDGSGALSGGVNYGVGIQAFDGVAATITGNVVVNAGTGIQASFTSGTSQPSGTISSNVVADSMFDGIFVGGSVTVSSNKIWGNNIGIEVPNSATVQSNSLFNNQTGIQFDCSTTPNVHSNTINDSMTGLASVPDSVGSSNTYVNVGTIRTSGC